MSIIILAGQSNMVGEGGVNGSYKWDGVVPPECQPNPNILRLNNDSQWEVAREPLHLGIGPVQPCGVGPGMPFTNISLWQRGMPHYNRTLARARDAVSSSGGVIRAMLWYQGESDTFYEPRAKSYKGKLVRFFDDVREDLQSPTLPIIQVAVVTGGVFLETVREAQLSTRLPNVFCVDARKLNVTIQNDTLNVHLDTRSQVRLGKALSTVFLNISASV